MVLSDVQNGKRVKLLAISAGCRLYSRLTGMGLIPGTEVEMLDNTPGRPLMLSLNGSRMALCNKMALNIEVSEDLKKIPEVSECYMDSGKRKNGMCKKICLRQMGVNQSGVIKSVKAEGELGRRIRDMGLVPNTEVTVIGRAPLKDPVALRLRDFTLSLRNNEADFITVEVAGG